MVFRGLCAVLFLVTSPSLAMTAGLQEVTYLRQEIVQYITPSNTTCVLFPLQFLYRIKQTRNDLLVGELSVLAGGFCDLQTEPGFAVSFLFQFLC